MLLQIKLAATKALIVTTAARAEATASEAKAKANANAATNSNNKQQEKNKSFVIFDQELRTHYQKQQIKVV